MSTFFSPATNTARFEPRYMLPMTYPIIGEDVFRHCLIWAFWGLPLEKELWTAQPTSRVLFPPDDSLGLNLWKRYRFRFVTDVNFLHTGSGVQIFATRNFQESAESSAQGSFFWAKASLEALVRSIIYANVVEQEPFFLFYYPCEFLDRMAA